MGLPWGECHGSIVRVDSSDCCSQLDLCATVRARAVLTCGDVFSALWTADCSVVVRAPIEVVESRWVAHYVAFVVAFECVLDCLEHHACFVCWHFVARGDRLTSLAVVDSLVDTHDGVGARLVDVYRERLVDRT